MVTYKQKPLSMRESKLTVVSKEILVVKVSIALKVAAASVCEQNVCFLSISKYALAGILGVNNINLNAYMHLC